MEGGSVIYLPHMSHTHAHIQTHTHTHKHTHTHTKAWLFLMGTVALYRVFLTGLR